MRVASTFVRITPTGEFYLVGYMNDIRKLPAVGIHDDPYSILLLMETGGTRLLFVSIDVCVVMKDKIEPIKQKLSENLGLPVENIVINSIHSHSCANGFDNGGLASRDNPDYVNQVKDAVIKAAESLPEKLVDVRSEYLRTNVRGWYSNRNDKTKPFDDEAIIISFKDKMDNIVGAFLNFNCHATVVGPQNRYLTTDIIGEVRRNIADYLGIIPYTFTGASGDLGNRQYRRGNDFNELKYVGLGIAEEIKKGSFKPISMDGFSSQVFHYPVCYDNSVYFEEYSQQLKRVQNELSTNLTADERKLHTAEEALLQNKLSIKIVDFNIACKIIKLGEVVIITFPGELASTFGMQLKQHSHGELTFIIGYADDYHGYFVAEDDYGSNYEALVTSLPKGEAEKMIEHLKEYL